VTAGCHEALKRTGQLQTFDASMCLGVLKGLHYLSKDICIPPAISLGQIGEVVSQYFDSRAGITRDFRKPLWTPCVPRGLAARERTFSCGAPGLDSLRRWGGSAPADARWSHPNH
jgi:hypothetical protein